MVEIAYDVVVICTIWCALASIFLFKDSSKRDKTFLLYIVFKAVFEIIAFVTSKYGNNLIGLHIYVLLQFIILAIFFKRCFEDFKKVYGIITILTIGANLIILNSIFLQPLDTYNSNSKVLVDLFLIVNCFILFAIFIVERFSSQDDKRATASFLSAVFLEGSMSVIYYLYADYILQLSGFFQETVLNLRLLTHYIVLFMIGFGLYQLYHEEVKIKK